MSESIAAVAVALDSHRDGLLGGLVHSSATLSSSEFPGWQTSTLPAFGLHTRPVQQPCLSVSFRYSSLQFSSCAAQAGASSAQLVGQCGTTCAPGRLSASASQLALVEHSQLDSENCRQQSQSSSQRVS